MRLLADVNVSAIVVETPRSRGIAVTRVPELMDARISDEEIVAFAANSDWIVVTHDQDLTAILAMNGSTRPSLLNVRTSSVEPTFLADCIEAALRGGQHDLALGAVVTVEDSGIRIRRLPIREPGS